MQLGAGGAPSAQKFQGPELATASLLPVRQHALPRVIHLNNAAPSQVPVIYATARGCERFFGPANFDGVRDNRVTRQLGFRQNKIAAHPESAPRCLNSRY